MSKLQELYEKVTKAEDICTKGRNGCCGCPCRATSTKCTFPKDCCKLIELQHAEIERLKAEGKEQEQ